MDVPGYELILTICYLLLITYGELLTTDCPLLPTTCYSLLTTYYALLTPCSTTTPSPHYPPATTHHLLLSTHSKRATAHTVLPHLPRRLQQTSEAIKLAFNIMPLSPLILPWSSRLPPTFQRNRPGLSMVLIKVFRGALKRCFTADSSRSVLWRRRRWVLRGGG